MATNGDQQNGSSGTHTQSQRYLSTRGEDMDVCSNFPSKDYNTS